MTKLNKDAGYVELRVDPEDDGTVWVYMTGAESGACLRPMAAKSLGEWLIEASKGVA